MKKNILYLTLGILLGCLITPLAINADSPIKLVVNGNNVTCDQPPIIMNGRILVPVRAVTEALGCAISWDQPTRTVTITQKNIVSSPVKTEPVQITPEKDNPKPTTNQEGAVNTPNEVETLKDYYIQGDVPCIKYKGTVYSPILAGMVYYKIPAADSIFYNEANKSITFVKLNKTYYAGNIENNDDVIYYKGRIYIKESILKTMRN